MNEHILIKNYLKSKPFFKRKYFCYAPFTSLHFWMNGNVSSCCYNRQPVGHYPEQTIREIWESAALAGFRNKIRNYDLSAGCFPCRMILSSGHYESFKASNYENTRIKKNHPTLLEFELDNTCNLECIQCRPFYSSACARAQNVEVPKIKYDAAFLQQLEEFIPHLEEARFFGGEPFLINIYYEIWERIRTRNPKCRIIVQTNATVLNEKIKNLIESTRFGFNISIDSLDKETYELIRKNASFEEVMHNLNYFSDYCRRKKTYLCISVCPMKINCREIPDFIEFCKKHHADLYYHIVNYPLKLSLRSFSSGELFSLIQFLKEKTFSSGNQRHRQNIAHYRSYIRQIESWHHAALLREKFPDAGYDKAIREITQKINRAYHDYPYNENIEELKHKIIRAIDLFREDIDFAELLANITQIPDPQFTEMLISKSFDELKELADEFSLK